MKNTFILDSPMGKITLIAQQEMLCGLEFGSVAEHAPSAVLYEAARQLSAYFEGKLQTFDLPLFLQGTAFQKEVWNALLKIPYGKCISYAEVARLCGHTKACRAVGSAVGKNPIPIIVPCHRVVCSDGSIGGFSCGLDKKRTLMDIERIEHEGVKIKITSI